jgi:energy-coupling factor transporter ATP-binding protein EcfA2
MLFGNTDYQEKSMFEAASLATAPAASTPATPRAVPQDIEVAAVLPPQPTTLRDTGLERPLVLALLAKTVAHLGKAHLPVLGGKLRLSMSVLREALALMLDDHLIEVARRGDSDIDIEYQLTGAGQAFAAAALAQCRYLGPAPVTLDAFCAAIERDAQRHVLAGGVGDAELAAALCDGPGDDMLDAAARLQLGAALHSGRAILLHGAPGCGKSTLALKLGRLLRGVVGVPHAVLIDHQIVQFYDPRVHLAPPPAQARQFDERRSDSRWLICQRPIVHLGSELTREMLDCRFDAAKGMYHAPPQLQASGGMLVIDDLGRHGDQAAALVGRLMRPLERGLDVLTLQGGHAETVPFDMTVVFATSDAPQQLLDTALLRRIAYKIELTALSPSSYLALLRRQCGLLQVPYDEAAATYLLRQLHGASRRPLLASVPRELVGRILDAASFSGAAPCLCPAALDQAWQSLFACSSPLDAASLVTDHVLLGEKA